MPKIILSSPRMPEPSDQQQAIWMQNFVETDEIWWIENVSSLHQLLDSSVLSPELRKQVLNSYESRVGGLTFAKAGPHYDLRGSDGHLLISNELMAKLPHEFIQKMYSYQYEYKHLKPAMFVRRSSDEEMMSTVANYEIPFEDKRFLMKQIITLEGDSYLPVSKFTWPHLPEVVKKIELQKQLMAKMSQRGLDAKIILNRGDDIDAVAKKFAGERKFEPIARYLRALLGSSESVEVPLQKIMHPLIRKNIDQYADCHGPNCINAGLNVNNGNNIDLKMSNALDLRKSTLSSYRFVKPGEELQAGDLLIYCTANGSVVHGASYVADGLVFTKNGFNKFRPYVFQTSDTVEEIYSSEGVSKVIALRVPKAGEKTAGESGAQTEYYRGTLPLMVPKEIVRETAEPHLTAPKNKFASLAGCLMSYVKSKSASLRGGL